MTTIEPVAEAAALLSTARPVVVVPGYGLALSRGQHVLAALGDALLDGGTEVSYVVHPLAGRLPGHLDLVLDEAGVPLHRRVGPEVAVEADVALVVGADDVVNPNAATDPASPLAGLDPVRLERVARVVWLTAAAGAGHAGVTNPLRQPPTLLLTGDAADLLRQLLAAQLRTSG